MKPYRLAGRKISFRSLWVMTAVALTAPLLMAQAGQATASESGLPVGRVWIRPTIVHVEPGQQQRFKILQPNWLLSATVMQGVKWSVNDVPGGDAEIGTIDSNGVYTAPAKAPTPHEIQIAPTQKVLRTVICGQLSLLARMHPPTK